MVNNKMAYYQTLYHKEGEANVYEFKFNMGAAHCGDVETYAIIDDKTKTIYVWNRGTHAWMGGTIRGDVYDVPYAGAIKLPTSGYVIKEMPEAEKADIAKAWKLR